jgi:acetyl/propionyl-CoA carboxylase alpha subunit
MFKKILIANRGEIAVRIARTAAEMGVATVAVFADDDAQSQHVKAADEAFALKGTGAGAYLDAAQIVAAARERGCEAVHPGYGFLSENAGFAALCAEAGVVFVGPPPEALELFGDMIWPESACNWYAVAAHISLLSKTSQRASVAYIPHLSRRNIAQFPYVEGAGYG